MNTPSKQAYALTLLQRRRICWRMARGWSLEKAAAAEGIALPDAEQLLGDADFVGLIDAYKKLADRPEEERHRRLVEMAWLVLEMAMIDGDVRVGLFILKVECRGRQPAAVIARAVLKSLNGRPPPGPMTVFVPPHGQNGLLPAPKRKPAKRRREPSCPVDGAISKGAAKARSGVLDAVESEAVVERVEEQAEAKAQQRRRCPPVDKMTTAQLMFLRIRNPNLAFGAATPSEREESGSKPEDDPRQPNGP